MNEQILRNLEKMSEKMSAVDNSVKLTKPEINHKLHAITASDATSIAVTGALSIERSPGLAGASVDILLAIVKEHTGSTSVIKASEHEAAAAARLLHLKRPVTRQAFVGRPLRQTIEITRWLLTNRHKEDFDVEERLTGWTSEQEHREWAEQVRANASEAGLEPVVLEGLREME